MSATFESLELQKQRSRLQSQLQQQQQHQEDGNNNDNEDTFFIARVFLQRSGNKKTGVKPSFSSTVTIPKPLDERYELNKKCNVLMFPVDEGILIKKLKL